MLSGRHQPHVSGYDKGCCIYYIQLVMPTENYQGVFHLSVTINLFLYGGEMNAFIVLLWCLTILSTRAVKSLTEY